MPLLPIYVAPSVVLTAMLFRIGSPVWDVTAKASSCPAAAQIPFYQEGQHAAHVRYKILRLRLLRRVRCAYKVSSQLLQEVE